MPSLSINHTIYRGEEAIGLEVEGDFYGGELEDFAFEPAMYKDTEGLEFRILLTENEEADIEEALADAEHDDFDEDKADAKRRGEW